MHFLSELIESPNLDDPAKKHMSIHRHFYRYSKGDFIGPALKHFFWDWPTPDWRPFPFLRENTLLDLNIFRICPRKRSSGISTRWIVRRPKKWLVTSCVSGEMCRLPSCVPGRCNRSRMMSRNWSIPSGITAASSLTALMGLLMNHDRKTYRLWPRRFMSSGCTRIIDAGEYWDWLVACSSKWL